MAKKCPDCVLCLDTVWIEPRRFLHCWLCDQYYDIVDGKLTAVDVEVEMGVHRELLRQQMYPEEFKKNEKFQ